MTDKPRSEPLGENGTSDENGTPNVEGQPSTEAETGAENTPAAEAEPAPPPTPEERAAAAEMAAKQSYDRMLRTAADFENFRKRARRDIDDAKIAGRSGVLREVVPVIDNLERALAHAGTIETAEARGIADGVGLVLRQFAQALERCGVVPVEDTGVFDPSIHEAVSQIESADAPPGTIAQVLQRGYKIGDRLFRPALVVVTRAPTAATEGNGAARDDTNGAGASGQNGYGNGND